MLRTGACHEEADAWEKGRRSPVQRVSEPKPLGLRTHRRRGWSRRLVVSLSNTRLPQHGLNLTFRVDLSGKRPLETPYHQDHHGPTGYHGPHLRDSKAKVDVGHNFLQYYALKIQ